MSIDAVSSANQAGTGTLASGLGSGATSSLGQDAFLKLLVTQLRNQDPTKPVADTEFIAQLAQFSSLEKLTQIADSTDSLLNVFKALGAQTAPTSQTVPTTK